MFGSYILRATCRSCLAFLRLILSGLGTCRDFMSVQSSQMPVGVFCLDKAGSIVVYKVSEIIRAVFDAFLRKH